MRRVVGLLGKGLSTVSEWDESEESSCPKERPLGILSGVHVEPSSVSDNWESSGGSSNVKSREEDVEAEESDER